MAGLMGDDRTTGELEADGDGPAAEALLEPGGPDIDGDGVMFEDGELRGELSRLEEADVVFSVGPVEADDGNEVGRMAWHGAPRLELGSGHAKPGPAKAIWRAGDCGCP
jgi:hypothetical protein